jgi:tetratricopeptide (TPR) repeat protein
VDPQHPDIWLDYSHVYLELGDLQQAQDTLKKGMNVQPDNPDLLYRLSIYTYRSGKVKEAYNLIEEALSLDYDGLDQLFSYYPNLKKDRNILNLIETHKKQNK